MCERGGQAVRSVAWEAEGRRTFNGGIVFVDKVALDELNCKATLAHTSAAHHDEFVLPHELRKGSAMAQCPGPSACARRARERGDGRGMTRAMAIGTGGTNALWKT